MPRAVEIVQAVASQAAQRYVQAFDQGDALLAAAGITTPIRQAHFLAQVLHETGGLQVLRESMTYTHADRILAIFGVGVHSAAVRPDEAPGLANNPQALAERVYGLGNPSKAKELGNTRPGDGFLFRGGGLLQTTGGANYRDKGDKIGVDLYSNPDAITDPANALQPALQEWTDGNLNAAADRNDILTVTKVINGGTNGLAERQQWFAQVWPIASGGQSAPAPAAGQGSGDEATRWLQDALNRLGAQPQLAVDGQAGAATTQAVQWFQASAGLAVDGIAGEATRAAIQQRLASA
jgi:putative chitinase